VNKIIEWLVYLLIVVSVFLTPTPIGGILPISFSGKLTSGYVMLILFIVTFISIIYRGKISYSSAHIYILGYFFLNIVSIIQFASTFNEFSSEPLYHSIVKTGVTNTLVIFSFFVYYELFTRLDISKIRKVLVWLTAGIVLSSIIWTSSIMYMAGGASGITNPYKMRHKIFTTFRDMRKKPDAYLDNENLFSIKKVVQTSGGTTVMGPLFALGFAILVGMLFNSGMIKAAFMSIPLLMLLIGLTSTASRSSMLSVVVALLVLLWLLIYKFKKYIYIIIILFSFMFLGVAYFGSDAFLHLSLLELSENARLELWKNGLGLIIENPFGYGNEYIRGMKYFRPELLSFYEMFSHNHLHNAYLQVLFRHGVLGFIVFITILIKALRVIFKMVGNEIKTKKTSAISGVTLLTGLAAVVVHFSFASLILTSEMTYAGAFWILLAIIFRMEKQSHEDTIA